MLVEPERTRCDPRAKPHGTQPPDARRRHSSGRKRSSQVSYADTDSGTDENPARTGRRAGLRESSGGLGVSGGFHQGNTLWAVIFLTKRQAQTAHRAYAPGSASAHGSLHADRQRLAIGCLPEKPAMSVFESQLVLLTRRRRECLVQPPVRFAPKG
jgi:hypothetical protein